MKRIVSSIILTSTLSLCFTSCNLARQNVKQDTDELVTCEQTQSVVEQYDIEKEKRYNEAFELIDKGDYNAAYKIFNTLGNYKDSEEQSTRFQYIPVKRLISCDNVEIVGEITLNENNLPIQIANRYETNKRIFDFAYDERGNLIQKAVSTEYEKTVYDYTYDEQNRLTKEICTFSNGHVNIFYYAYDTNGQLINETCEFYDGSVKITDYQYDSFGKLTQERVKYSSDTYTNETRYDYIYDASGNLIKQVQTTQDGAQITFDFVYDTNGNLLRRVHNLYNGAQAIYECAYDANGNLIQEVYIETNGEKYVYDAVYDADGNMIEGGYTAQGADREVYRRAYYKGDKLVKDVYTDSVSNYTYDEQGNIIKKSLSKSQGEDLSIEYEYKFVYVGYDIPQEVEQRIDDVRNDWKSFEEWYAADKG